MKKYQLFLALILSMTSAFAASGDAYRKHAKQELTEFCLELLSNENEIKKKAEATKFCQNVAKCVVDNAPSTASLDSQAYMQRMFRDCLYDEADKFSK